MPPVSEKHGWTDETIARLRLLWEAGWPASAIGADLGFTRNKVLGKAHRLGLPRRVTAELKAEQAAKAAARKRRPRTNGSRSGGIVKAMASRIGPSLAPRAPAPPVRHEPVQCEPVLFAQATNGRCRWPLWDDTTPAAKRMVCGVRGCDMIQGRPYCAAHTAIGTANGSAWGQISVFRFDNGGEA